MADGTQPCASPLRLGFGCGSLGTEVDYRASCRLIETAYDCGFRHFDVAPPYGHGRAERILGDVLSSVSGQVRICTKVGIAHPRSSSIHALRRILLPLKRLFPSLWATGANRVRAAAAPRGRFGSSEVRASLEESIRRLRVRSLDSLLLHQVRHDDITPELLDLLDRLRSDGMVTKIGIGTSVDETLVILDAHRGRFDVVQANHYWAAYRPELLGRHCLITHRCVRTGLQVMQTSAFRDTLKENPSLAALRAAIDEPATAADLLLAAGLLRNRDGLLLVSSSRPDRIRRFATVALSPDMQEIATTLDSCLQNLSATMPSPDPN